MGVERAVTRWYARHQVIQGEIAVLQARLEQLPPGDENQATIELAEAERQLAVARKRLLDLGPCPKPMMG